MQRDSRIKSLRINIDVAVYVALCVFFAVFLFSFDYSSGKPMVILSFFVNGLFFLYMVIRKQQNVTLRRNFYIFNLIFFFFAPLQQYLSGTVLWKYNGMRLRYTHNDYLRANAIILCFCICFEIIYYLTGRKSKKTITQQQPTTAENTQNLAHKSPPSTWALVLISVLCLISSVVTDGFSNLKAASALKIQIVHMVNFAPAISLVICLVLRRMYSRSYKKSLVLLWLTFIVSYVVYSGDMARFMLLGAIMTIVSFLFSDYKRKSLYVLIYVFGFFFAFSMMRYINLLETNILHFVDFRQNDYDAYQMLMMTISYVEEQGVSYGMNFVSALFCLIPRSIAPWRFEATGRIVISYYRSWFTNVSCPLVAEAYFAFGIVGVVLIGCLLGYVVKKIDFTIMSSKPFQRGMFAIISGLSIYILRGALLAAWSYTIGLLIAYWAIFKLTYLKLPK